MSDWGDQGAGASTEQTDLSDYRLTRDREKRHVKAPNRYGYTDLIAFAFSVADKLCTDEPRSYNEAITRKDS